MRLANIRVTNLFGHFDHIIEIRLEDRITIIHGPNGYGKTAILQMVEALLTNKSAVFRRIPFELFAITFDDGSVLEVQKEERQRRETAKPRQRRPSHTLKYTFTTQDQSIQEHILDGRINPNELDFPLHYVTQRVPQLLQIGPETWQHTISGQTLDLEDVLNTYSDYFPSRLQLHKKSPPWLRKIAADCKVRLIEAQRLFNVADSKNSPYRTESPTLEPSVSSYSRELAGRIQEKQAQYGTFSQQLDSSFPTRVLQKRLKSSDSVNELTDKLHELEQLRQRIIEAGLLDRDPNAPALIDPERQVDDSTKGILSLYVEDAENKLSVFNDITDRIELFKELVNKRFTYKHVAIDRRSGFQFRSEEETPLLPTDLSSGEQHELVLLYELLFKTEPDSLILIDEPELSLHVGWQVEFLQDLNRVIRLSSFDVVLATHSPQIINNRWDLAVELHGR